jgi:flagellar biosynthesis/type III secretory pathway chaperone
MMHGTPSLQPVLGDGRDRLEDLVELINALIAVVSEENAALAKGHPASQSRYTEMKIRLGDQFEQWVKDVSRREVLLCSPDRALQERVLQRIACLCTAMNENMVRLRAAMAASQRRIDAVMDAIRGQIADASPYNATGRVNGHSASYAKSVRI